MTNKTHLIDGVQYVEVERKAEVGERVLAVNYEEDDTGIKSGDILVVEFADYCDWSITVAKGGGFFDIEVGDKYLVLEPVKPNLAELVSRITPENRHEEVPDITDLLANLARRVASLEQQLTDTQRNIERQAEEIATLKELAESNEEDIDTLDDRTQVLNAIQKYYGGGSR